VPLSNKQTKFCDKLLNEDFVWDEHSLMDVGRVSGPCEFGVPQGSVLGLFVLSPIVNVISVSVSVFSWYADDTQLYISLKDESSLSLSAF